MKGRKGEKELQMIFGLFILLIISLVVLKLFFGFASNTESVLRDQMGEFTTKAAITDAIQACETLCGEITDINTGIEFCGKYMRIDFNGDKAVIGQKATRGRWDMCESKVPCFVLVDNCKDGLYSGLNCNTILNSDENNRADYYNKLYNDDLSVASGGTSTPADGCGMEEIQPADASPNWKRHFKFDIAYTGNGPQP